MTPTPATAPVSALDVAEYILGRLGPLDGWKLQKLVYYCQAWSLVWRGSPIYGEKVQAWVHGPVVAELYQMHSGQRNDIRAVGGHAEHVLQLDRTTIDEVLRYYGDFDGQALRDQTHREQPWKAARGNLAENLPSTAEITADAMRAFYSSRPCGEDVPLPDLSVLSPDTVARSRQQIAEGHWVDIEDLGRVGAAQN